MTNESGDYVVAAQARGGAGMGDFRYEREALDPIGATILEIPAKTDAEFAEAARNADAVIAPGRRINAEIIEGLDRCVVIGLSSVGADTVDVEAATKKGIVVTNVPDIFVEEVADHTISLMFAAARRLKLMDRLMREGKWREARAVFRDLPRVLGQTGGVVSLGAIAAGGGRPVFSDVPRFWGQTVGLISFGNIARAVARRCQPFGLHVIAYDPFVSELTMTAEGVEPVGFMEMLERSDYVSMHAPLNAETRPLMKREHFAAMKSSAIFVNNGRGPTVDEAALIAALEDGEIAGAGLDVFEVEPTNPENPLLHMDNVIVTPHIASATARMMPETRRRTGREVATALQGRWPRSAVNPEVLPHTNLRRWQPYPMNRGPNR